MLILCQDDHLLSGWKNWKLKIVFWLLVFLLLGLLVCVCFCWMTTSWTIVAFSCNVSVNLSLLWWSVPMMKTLVSAPEWQSGSFIDSRTSIQLLGVCLETWISPFWMNDSMELIVISVDLSACEITISPFAALFCYFCLPHFSYLVIGSCFWIPLALQFIIL